MAAAFQSDAFQGDTFEAGASVSASAGHASGTGAASVAAASLGISGQNSVGTGAASSPTASLSTGTETAAGAGASGSPSASLFIGGGTAAGTGAAGDATVSTDVETSALAEAAAGTGSAPNATASLGLSGGLAAGAGAASSVFGHVAPVPATAAGSGAAADAAPVASPHTQASAGHAAGTGAVLASTRTILSNARPAAGKGKGTAYLARRFATPIVISYNEVDITPDVDLATARFTAQVNGNPGTAFFKVRDDGHTHSFISGGDLALDINGVRMWGGYLNRASRVYPFPVQDTTAGKDQTANRYWEMGGVDYNILFTKRIIYDPANPTTKLSFDYPVGTYDDTIVADLFDNYLDIEDDGLRRAGVTRVDVVTLDIKGVTSGKGTLTNGRGQVASFSYTWKQAMDVISRATGAVYYIDPVKNLHYVDVDTADAAYVLSDQPTVGQVGYRDFNLSYNGTNLVNDMMVWGQAIGSDTTVFSRAQNSTSQTAHNVWQGGLVTSGLYKQASTDLVASSYLNGTPQSQRGGKDDAVSLTCKVMGPYFNVGQKVTTEVNIFGYSDVLPVRRQELYFTSPDQAVCTLTLSHDIDQPWSIFEQLPFTLPTIRIPEFILPSLGGGCECGITDSFIRVEAVGWGVSDAGLAWDVDGATTSVDGVRATITSDGFLENGTLTFLAGAATGLTVVCEMDAAASDDDDIIEVDFGASTVSGFPTLVWTFARDGDVTLSCFTPFATSSGTASFVPNVEHNLRLAVDTTTGYAKVWPVGDPEPGAWLLTVDINLDMSARMDTLALGVAQSGAVDLVGYFATLDISGVDRCTEYRFDNFNRITTFSIGQNWGTSDHGETWQNGFGAGTANNPYCDGIHGVMNADPNISILSQEITSDLFINDAITMTTQFHLANVDTSVDTGTELSIIWKPASLSPNVIDQVAIYPVNINGSGGLSLVCHGGGGDWFDIDSGWSSGVAYALTVERGPTLLRAKVWDLSTAEPGWQIELTDRTPTADNTILVVQWDRNSEEDGAVKFNYINFDYEGKPCYDAGPLPAPGLPLTGPVCEVATWLNDSHSQVSRRFVTNSAEVYVNGSINRRGASYSYTEDGDDGMIIWNHVNDEANVVYVCYTATGPL